MVIWLQKVILKEKVLEDVFGRVCGRGGARGLLWVNRMGLWTQFARWLKKQMNTKGAS